MKELSYRSPCNGAPVYFTPETDTTMVDARALVADGAPSGVVVVTDYQRTGRGRLAERTWTSPAGAGLLFTVALADISNPGSFPLRCGLAVAQAVEALFGVSAAIKWPNDLLVADKKLCGVLCEHASPWTFAGFGINLHQQQFHHEIAATATSLSLLGATEIDRDELLRTILSSLCRLGNGWQDRLRDRLWRRGEIVSVLGPDGAITRSALTRGILTDIDVDGCLLLQTGGATIRVLSGELLVRR